ncbi:hypothetical protein PGB90_006644 [Kerria lacca]
METEKKIDASSSNFDSLQSNIFAQKSVICDGTLNENAVCMLTSEAFPRMTNYRNNPGIKRPSLGELHDEYNIEKKITTTVENEYSSTEEHGFKLGWIQGVLIPCLLNIWGVMLFLRMPWIVAQSGIFQATVIIIISTIICGLTTLSLSALCTNGEVKGGGIYFIISRSLGPEFGASVGIVLAFANAVSASLNTIGFCESLNDLLLQRYNVRILENDLDSIRVVGVISIFVMILICGAGIEWESKAQNILIALIIFAMGDFFIGTSVGPQGDPEKISKGFYGLSWSLFNENWGSDYRETENVMQNFFSIFAIFFPSVTGIQAGANISGDLKDPSSSIPKGTLLSLLISMLSYIGVVFFSGIAAIRDTNGNMSIARGNMTLEEYCGKSGCEFGLHNDYTIMQMMSIWSIWIYIGCFAATLSTALTNLLTVPRLLKALGDDEIYPGLSYFAKEYGKNKEPYRGYVLTFLFSSAFVLVASLNEIAPLISNFYLASYALINFCTFHAALVRPLGWRPTFTFYNKWLSLFSCILCIIVMFFIHWITSIATFFTFFTLYLLVMYRQPDVNWGSTTQAQLYKSTLASSYRLINVDEHVKNYQPHILLMSGYPKFRPDLLDLANLFTKNSALLICGNVITCELSHEQRKLLIGGTNAYLNERKIKAFSSFVDGLTFENGAKAMIQCCGIGKLRPNILMMGYKTNWRSSSSESLQEYFNILHIAFDNRMSVVILRMPKMLEVERNSNTTNGEINPAFIEEGNWTNNLSNHTLNNIFTITEMKYGVMPKASPFPLRRSVNTVTKTPPLYVKKSEFEEISLEKYEKSPKYSEVSKQMSVFSTKLKDGIIDVWWLYDDGGLTMLLPYILNSRSIWSGNFLRIFTLANNESQIKTEEQNMANLLTKFRIHYSSLTVLTDVHKPLHQETRKLFDELIKPYKNDPSSKTYISDEELKLLEDKTNHQLRLKELLVEHSSNSNLVVMSLPMPRKGIVSAAVYKAWLEILTSDMPPFLLVRGNHVSVLTFYS